MKTIAIINGPNLNLLGTREVHHYGQKTLDDINSELSTSFSTRARLSFFQSNHEGAIIDYLQGLQAVDAIVINPGAFTHTSIAIRDTLLAINVLAVEVHLSNVFKREDFRKHSYFSDICLGVISGLGALGYHFAVEAILQKNK